MGIIEDAAIYGTGAAKGISKQYPSFNVLQEVRMINMQHGNEARKNQLGYLVSRDGEEVM